MKNTNNYSNTLINNSKQKSRNMTLPERILWFQILQKRQLNGLKFIKQKVVSKYIVDFYCPELNLVIELDGNSHDAIQEQDKIREEVLNDLGLSVLRLKNADVLNNLDGVFEYLKIITSR